MMPGANADCILNNRHTVADSTPALAEAEEIRLELLNAMEDLDIDGDIAAQQKSRSPSRQVR